MPEVRAARGAAACISAAAGRARQLLRPGPARSLPVPLRPAGSMYQSSARCLCSALPALCCAPAAAASASRLPRPRCQPPPPGPAAPRAAAGGPPAPGTPPRTGGYGPRRVRSRRGDARCHSRGLVPGCRCRSGIGAVLPASACPLSGTGPALGLSASGRGVRPAGASGQHPAASRQALPESPPELRAFLARCPPCEGWSTLCPHPGWLRESARCRCAGLSVIQRVSVRVPLAGACSRLAQLPSSAALGVG